MTMMSKTQLQKEFQGLLFEAKNENFGRSWERLMISATNRVVKSYSPIIYGQQSGLQNFGSMHWSDEMKFELMNEASFLLIQKTKNEEPVLSYSPKRMALRGVDYQHMLNMACAVVKLTLVRRVSKSERHRFFKQLSSILSMDPFVKSGFIESSEKFNGGDAFGLITNQEIRLLDSRDIQRGADIFRKIPRRKNKVEADNFNFIDDEGTRIRQGFDYDSLKLKDGIKTIIESLRAPISLAFIEAIVDYARPDLEPKIISTSQLEHNNAEQSYDEFDEIVFEGYEFNQYSQHFIEPRESGVEYNEKNVNRAENGQDSGLFSSSESTDLGVTDEGISSGLAMLKSSLQISARDEEIFVKFALGNSNRIIGRHFNMTGQNVGQIVQRVKEKILIAVAHLELDQNEEGTEDQRSILDLFVSELTLKYEITKDEENYDY